MLQTEIAENLKRFMVLIPKGGDKTLVILKSHLLIEELITELLKYKLQGSNPLNIEVNHRMMFANKLQYCWALVQEDMQPNIWYFLKGLNSIRNKMAHSVEPEGIDEKIEQFTNSVINSEYYNMPKERGSELEYSLAWLYIVLNQCLYSVKNS
jgi:hypothetical protein